MKIKDLKRRWDLKRITSRLKRLSRREVSPMSGEEQLRQRVQRDLTRHGRFGIDDVLAAINKVIDSHVVDMEAELFRRHVAEDVKLGQLAGEISGRAAQYHADENHLTDAIRQLTYQRSAAQRMIEDRDTPMPAGRDGVEEPGFQHGNVGELAGRGLVTRILLYIVLLMAMVADLVTFRQVVERVLNDTAVFPLVLALTVTTTYIAHWAGKMFKAAKLFRRAVRRAHGAWALFGTWLAMGLGAFVFRLLAPAPVGSSSLESYVNAGGASGSADGSPVLSAMLLLLLYLLTGAVALTAGYQDPRPEIGQYKRSNRALRRLEPSLAALRRDVVHIGALETQVAGLRRGAEAQYLVEVGRCQAAARRLKAEAQMITRRLVRGEEQNWLRRLIGGRATRSQDEPLVGTVERARDDDTVQLRVVDGTVGRSRPTGTAPVPPEAVGRPGPGTVWRGGMHRYQDDDPDPTMPLR